MVELGWFMVTYCYDSLIHGCVCHIFVPSCLAVCPVHVLPCLSVCLTDRHEEAIQNEFTKHAKPLRAVDQCLGLSTDPGHVLQPTGCDSYQPACSSPSSSPCGSPNLNRTEHVKHSDRKTNLDGSVYVRHVFSIVATFQAAGSLATFPFSKRPHLWQSSKLTTEHFKDKSSYHGILVLKVPRAMSGHVWTTTCHVGRTMTCAVASPGASPGAAGAVVGDGRESLAAT